MSDYSLQAEEEMWNAIASQPDPPQAFQVFAVYPSGNEYPVRDSHTSRAAASSHVRRCNETADPCDTWTYYYREMTS